MSYRVGDVSADINYFRASGEVIEPSSWKPRYLGVGDEYTKKMTIHNIRGIEQNFDLENNGFQFVKLSEKQRNTDDENVILEEYYPELEQLVKGM